MDIRQAIGKVEVLKHANPASLAMLAPYAVLKRVQKGGHLFFDKDDVRHLYFAIEGNLSLYKLNSLDEKKVIFIYGPGQMLNEVMVQDMPASINCEAVGDSLVLYFPKDEFIKVMESDFRLAKAVMDSMATKIRRLYRQLKNTGGSVRIDKRLAAKLWKLSRDYGVPCDGGIIIDLDLTVTYLAEMLGSKRETVSRQLRLLVDEGVVALSSGDYIIPDMDRLKEYFLDIE